MEGYLGEFPVDDLVDTPYADYALGDWAMHWIETYGQIAGHQAWVLDQVARILKGTPVIVKLAKWENGLVEYREMLGEPSQQYLDWVAEMTGENDEYSYDVGTPP